MTCLEIKSAIKAASENPPQEFWDNLLQHIKNMDGNEKICAAGSYVIHKHIKALKELAKGEPGIKRE